MVRYQPYQQLHHGGENSDVELVLVQKQQDDRLQQGSDDSGIDIPNASIRLQRFEQLRDF